MTRKLPLRPSLEQLKKQAKTILKGQRAAEPRAIERIRLSNPRWQRLTDAEIAATPFTLADAQRAIANEFGFENWSRLKAHIVLEQDSSSTAETVNAIREAAG